MLRDLRESKVRTILWWEHCWHARTRVPPQNAREAVEAEARHARDRGGNTICTNMGAALCRGHEIQTLLCLLHC